MNDADRSDDAIQHLIDDGIARARRETARSLPSIGICHWCESPVTAGRIFCSKVCSDLHEHDKQRRKDLGL